MKKSRLLTKAERRERSKPKMKVTGASVKMLHRIIISKGNARSRRSS